MGARQCIMYVSPQDGHGKQAKHVITVAPCQQGLDSLRTIVACQSQELNRITQVPTELTISIDPCHFLTADLTMPIDNLSLSQR